MKSHCNLLVRRAGLLVLGICLTVLACENSHAQTIFQNDFDHYTSSRRYKVADLEADWNTPEWNDGVSEGRVRIERSSKALGGTGACLAVKYPPNLHGTSNTGAQWKMDFDDAYEEVIATYYVKFKNGTDFVKGGKLPGLAGGTAPTGNAPANGTNGWAARMMWLTPFTGTPGSPRQTAANLIAYAKYHQSGYRNDGRDEDEIFFTDSGDLVEIEDNRWYKIKQRIKMNNPSSSNGKLQIWLDNKRVVNRHNIRYRTNSNLGIDVFYFSTFYGGNYSWRTSRWTTAYFDDFKISVVN